MAVVDTTRTFINNEQVTSTKLNEIMDNSLFVSGAVASGGGLEVTTGGQMQIKDSGVTSAKIPSNAITTAKIADGNVTPAKLSTGGPSWTNNALTTGRIIELGGGITESANSQIDFHSVYPTTSYEARIIRDSGVDGDFSLVNTGANPIVMDASGGVTFGNANMPNPSGTAPIYGCRAWVNFNGQVADNVSGNYTRSSSTTVTIDTASNHGLVAGNVVWLDFTVSTGTAPFDGLYQVASITDENTFTVVSSASTSSTGTVSLRRQTIRASGNISCVSAAAPSPIIPPISNDAIGNGYYVVNFTSQMPDANFAISGSCNEAGELVASSGNDIVGGFGYNEKCAFITTVSGGSTAVDCLHNSIQIIR